MRTPSNLFGITFIEIFHSENCKNFEIDENIFRAFSCFLLLYSISFSKVRNRRCKDTFFFVISMYFAPQKWILHNIDGLLCFFRPHFLHISLECRIFATY